MPANLAGELGQNLVAVVELDPKVTAFRDQDDFAVEMNQLFFAHVCPWRTLGYHYLGARKSAPEPRLIYPAAVERQPPRATSDEIDLYIRTYYSLLRSSGDVRVRAFEEAHLFSRSSLHLGAEAPEPDLAAFAYSAARLPECMPRIRRIVLGQSQHQ